MNKNYIFKLAAIVTLSLYSASIHAANPAPVAPGLATPTLNLGVLKAYLNAATTDPNFGAALNLAENIIEGIPSLTIYRETIVALNDFQDHAKSVANNNVKKQHVLRYISKITIKGFKIAPDNYTNFTIILIECMREHHANAVVFNPSGILLFNAIQEAVTRRGGKTGNQEALSHLLQRAREFKLDETTTVAGEAAKSILRSWYGEYIVQPLEYASDVPLDNIKEDSVTAKIDSLFKTIEENIANLKTACKTIKPGIFFDGSDADYRRALHDLIFSMERIPGITNLLYSIPVLASYQALRSGKNSSIKGLSDSKVNRIYLRNPIEKQLSLVEFTQKMFRLPAPRFLRPHYERACTEVFKNVILHQRNHFPGKGSVYSIRDFARNMYDRVVAETPQAIRPRVKSTAVDFFDQAEKLAREHGKSLTTTNAITGHKAAVEAW